MKVASAAVYVLHTKRRHALNQRLIDVRMTSALVMQTNRGVEGDFSRNWNNVTRGSGSPIGTDRNLACVFEICCDKWEIIRVRVAHEQLISLDTSQLVSL